MVLDFSTKSLGLIHGPVWHKALSLAAVLPPPAMTAPVPAFDWHAAMKLEQEPADDLGNNTYGCCQPAGDYRLSQMAMANAWGSSWKPTKELVLAAYTARTNPPFNPATGANDSGTLISTAQEVDYVSGLPIDSQTLDVKIPLTIDPQNLDHLRRSAWLLGGIGLCLALPVGWQNTLIWDANAGTPGSWGGHFVPSGKWNPATGLWTVISWGIEIVVTEAALTQYLVQGIANLSHLWLSAKGLTPSGLSWDQLSEIRTQLGE